MICKKPRILKSYSETQSQRQLPKNFDSKDHALFSSEYLRIIHETNIYLIRNIDILRDMIFKRSHLTFFSEHTFTHIVTPSNLQHISRLKYFLKSRHFRDKGIWILDNWSGSYFHWLTDALTRLIAAESLLEGHVVLLPKAFENLRYVSQSLEMLKINYIYFNSYERLHVNELLLTSHTAITGNYNKEIINMVRKRFISLENTRSGKKIYISRHQATKRKVINEEQILHLLENFGFEIHHFEEYDFIKQVHLMSHSTHLVGLHGAGLTNMLFMAPKGKILELRNNDETTLNCYFTLASELDHEYYYLLNNSDSPNTHIANITVDTKRLTDVLKLMTCD